MFVVVHKFNIVLFIGYIYSSISYPLEMSDYSSVSVYECVIKYNKKSCD